MPRHHILIPQCPTENIQCAADSRIDSAVSVFVNGIEILQLVDATRIRNRNRGTVGEQGNECHINALLSALNISGVHEKLIAAG